MSTKKVELLAILAIERVVNGFNITVLGGSIFMAAPLVPQNVLDHKDKYVLKETLTPGGGIGFKADYEIELKGER